MSEDMSMVATESPEERFFKELATGVPKVQLCKPCGHRFFFPRTHCPTCASTDYTWVNMGLEGTIYSYSNIPAKSHGAPYNVVMVDMDEGFRMMSTCPDAQLDASCIGKRVVARVDGSTQPARLIFSEAH